MFKIGIEQNTLNCAVVGLGIGERHAEALIENPKCQLKYICDFDDEKVQNFQRKYGKQYQSDSFESIIEDADIKLVCIASFDDAHYEQVKKGLTNRKHIFVEKPLCQKKEELSAIVRLWRSRNMGLSSNLVLRKAPLFVWLQNTIASGALGEIYAFDGDYLYGRLHKITGGWRNNIEDYSVMASGGIHIIDLMLTLTKQKPIKVQSCSNKLVTKNTDFRYSDFQSSIMYFESGMIARITANFGCVHRHQHALRIFGTKGTFLLDDLGPRIHWNREEGNVAEKINLAPKPQSKGELIPDFVETIFKGNFAEGAAREFDLMSVVLAADEALHYTHPISIEYLQ